VGALFRSYLLQNVSSAHVSETSVGICNAGLGNVASIWKADVTSTQNQKYQEWGGETVDLVWKP
jgi:thiaminase